MRGCHQKLKNKNIKQVLDEDFKLEYNHARMELPQNEIIIIIM